MTSSPRPPHVDGRPDPTGGTTALDGGSAPARGYLLDNARAEAGERFGWLAELFDPVTRGHLERLGLGAGWRCWEVGAGGPSIPAALAAAVGPTGHVLATDIDPSWLTPGEGANSTTSTSTTSSRQIRRFGQPRRRMCTRPSSGVTRDHDTPVGVDGYLAIAGLIHHAYQDGPVTPSTLSPRKIPTPEQPYQARRQHRRRRTISLLVILAAAAGTVWITVIGRTTNTDAQVQCTAPTSAPGATITHPATEGRPLPYTALDTVTPAPPVAVRVRVLNAGNQHGQAGLAGDQLQQLGFTLAARPGNDPLYPHGDMRCLGQIRFGPNGEAAARTLSLAVPCTQLVRDNRPDATVDLALGTNFTAVTPNSAADQVLAQLATWARHHPKPTGGLQSASEALPHLDSALLTAAHVAQC